MDRGTKIVLIVISIMVFWVILATAWLFLYKKDYDFMVEAPCDPKTEKCFYRDCSEEGVCPPNEYENYKIFQLKARDFFICSDNSCAQECLSERLACTIIECGDSEEDVCATEPAQIKTSEE